VTSTRLVVALHLVVAELLWRPHVVLRQAAVWFNVVAVSCRGQRPPLHRPSAAVAAVGWTAL
jgi:hypothetical protein